MGNLVCKGRFSTASTNKCFGVNIAAFLPTDAACLVLEDALLNTRSRCSTVCTAREGNHWRNLSASHMFCSDGTISEQFALALPTTM